MTSDSIWLNVVVYLVSATAIWWAGTRLEHTADRISERTGLGQAFTGMLLLAAATSLPEFATTITAIAVLHNPTLAVHNLLGGVAMQTALIAVADAVKGRRGALTSFSPRFVLLIQGVGLLFLLQITIAGITARGAPSVLSVSAWLVVLFAVYVGMAYLTYRNRENPRWKPADLGDSARALVAERADPGADGDKGDEGDGAGSADASSAARMWLWFGGLSLLVLVGGWFATHSAEVLARKTGLGSAFLGATLLALATSLPELSTTVSASRSGRYTVVVSNVFGSNAFDVVLLLLADLLYRPSSVLAHAETSVIFVAAVGAIMTCIYLWGLLEHEDRTVAGIGWDSAAVIVVYVGGMAVLYTMS